MRLFPGKISAIAEESVHVLVRDADIEAANPDEVKLDMEAVLKEYLRLDRDVGDEAKSRMQSRGLDYSNLGKVRSQIAKERGAPPQDEVLPYLVDQILRMLFHSSHVDEVFVEDAILRQKITAVLRRHMEVETELDKEVRTHIRNLEEGTFAFDTEYKRVMEQVKRRRGLSE